MKQYLLLASALVSTAAPASVIVLANHKTGEVVIEGNSPGGTEADRAVALAEGGSSAGWVQIFGPDDDRPGWGKVLCVRHKQGYFFAEAIGNSSEEEADRIATFKANRFIARLVGGDAAGDIEKSATWAELARQAEASGLAEKIECAPAWNNQSQRISHVGKSATTAEPKAESVAAEPAAATVATWSGSNAMPASENKPSDNNSSNEQVASAPTPKRDYEAEYQAKLRVWEQQQAEHRRKVEEHEEAQRKFEARKVAQRDQAQNAAAEYQRQLAEHAATTAALAEDYRRKQAELGVPQASGSGTSIADAFKVQNDAEWKKISEGLPQPRDLPGATWAFCYQASHVDSVLYHTMIFSTQKQRTELELAFADQVARITRIGSGMSTHCHLSKDPTYLDHLRANVRKVHSGNRPEQLPSPR